MKILELIDVLSSMSETLDDNAEVFIEQEGVLCEFDIEQTEEQFDGFFSFYPAGLKFVLR